MLKTFIEYKKNYSTILLYYIMFIFFSHVLYNDLTFLVPLKYLVRYKRCFFKNSKRPFIINKN